METTRLVALRDVRARLLRVDKLLRRYRADSRDRREVRFQLRRQLEAVRTLVAEHQLDGALGPSLAQVELVVVDLLEEVDATLTLPRRLKRARRLAVQEAAAQAIASASSGARKIGRTS